MSYARAQHERQKADQWSASGNGLSWTRNWTSSDRVLRSRNRIQDCLKSLQRTFLREVYGAHADSVSRGLKERPEDLEAGDVILVANPEVNHAGTWLVVGDHAWSAEWLLMRLGRGDHNPSSEFAIPESAPCGPFVVTYEVQAVIRKGASELIRRVGWVRQRWVRKAEAKRDRYKRRTALTVRVEPKRFPPDLVPGVRDEW